MRCCVGVRQAATAAAIEAKERWSQSPESYRMQVADDMYKEHLKKICGDDGAGGGEGQVPFPVKKRQAKDGGNWDMSKSIELRPKELGSIYAKAKDVHTKSTGIYTVLCNEIRQDHKNPSGWNDEDVILCILYNLRLRYMKAQADARRAKAVDVEEEDAAREDAREESEDDEDDGEGVGEEEELMSPEAIRQAQRRARALSNNYGYAAPAPCRQYLNRATHCAKRT